MYQATSSKNGESSSSQPPQQQQNDNEPEQEQHGDTCSIPPAQSGNIDSRSRGSANNNTVFKSGHLSISSKGLGWTSWKKRWFILTRTSLVFFRSDPSAVQQRGGEVNLTLGGIDLNNSGSVVVKADKKLLTVLFPDGRDGRAFTLRADTMEDLQEWKTALENALMQAPSASHVMGQNGIFRNDHAPDAPPADVDEPKEETPTNLTVFGRPILLALEEVDGSPSFLEKALRFVEDHGAKTEGILRQAADVDDVNHRIREYEQGRNEFTPTEDAHVIGDCLKTVLREMPSSPVPASCCNALLEACRDRGHRVNAMREAISESFPEPNRRLLQRILMMMLVVASNKNVNRMNTNAVAACMAPLLLRPLLHGDCEIENDFDVGGDGSAQLLQAAAAANHAQAIVITLLEDYENIFGEGSLSAGLYSDSEESGSGTEEGTDDEEYDDDDGTQGSEDYTDEEEDLEGESEGSYSESEAFADHHGDDIDHHDDGHKARSHTKINDNLSSESKSPKGSMKPKVPKKLLSGSNRSSLPRYADDDARKDDNILVKGSSDEVSKTEDRNSSTSDVASASKEPSSERHWGRAHGKRNLSIESIELSAEVDEADADVERLETTKTELQNRITEEVKNNKVLHSSLERRKKALYVRREALEKDVERLQEQLQQERDKRSALEVGLKMSKGNKPIQETTDVKLNKDLQEVAQAEDDITNLEHKVDDLENRLGKQDVKASGASKGSRRSPEHNAKMKEKQKDTEAAASTLKEGHWDARGNEKERQHEPRGKSSQKLAGTSKRSGSKGEGNTTTTSALSKLTMRLNFLKERRSQIANELSNMDKGKSSSGQPSPSSGQKRSPQETERGGTGSNQNQNQDSDSSKLNSPHVLDRGRSDNGGDRSKGSGGGNHPSTTPRTFSR
ncbi:Rho GTPase activation protein (RhoGAP) with PH domain [Raphanus sativus]|uniref:Rho GTPase-activating protein REN1-like isoform X3 n=1 Tax=Raphanus sativus TaxID=3726 RepID=A0A9W3CPG8_RAPSA|nr:rho GTPase-activating protein REN1-like isoform X3 [Raphanus sativus]KAJ4871656.1 Rho GTPase activation protein (RhoGAP) with PH domain [Raphanus sativus]